MSGRKIIIGAILWIGTICGALMAQADTNGRLSVLDFGAAGDGRTDCTAAFQMALDKAGRDEIGGTVFVPAGNYLIAGHLNIPSNVTLEGIWQIPTAWTQHKGSTLLAVEGDGNPAGAPFITLWNNSVVKGLTVFYPNQVHTNPPKAYPWTIASGGSDNSSIIDVLLVNPYQAVDFGSKPAGRHYIRNLYGQPLLKGLYVDQCYDIGRVENVHFWPFWTCGRAELNGIQDFITANGEAFIFGRTDWEYVFNTFSWGYKIGYHFIRTDSGVANGNFLGIGADATNKALLVDDCAPYGLLITNGEFVSMLGPEPTSVDVSTSNTGVVQFQNCAFWGPAARIAKIEGAGTVTFNTCNFSFWDFGVSKLPAIEASGGNLIVTSSNFGRPGQHILLNPGVASAVITGNRFSGSAKIMNKSKGDVQIGLNTGNLPRKKGTGPKSKKPIPTD
ncbi:MAG TPA: glycosyl hydrolase family 28-related protein [Candidatus Sumerlaeota bacterium]|nr:glycosyl hydrolase family 28-related protein [Candidatus Sumerlaeota bacterium]